MTLGDMENYVLEMLQQPGANFTNGVPDWGKLTNPQFGKATLDFFLNRGYRQLLADTTDFALYLVNAAIPSTAQTYKYVLPEAGYPNVFKVHRVFYAPKGQNYTREYVGGSSFLSWERFQFEYTAQGYLQRFAWGTQPAAMAMHPDRKTLYLYPGSAIAGDTLTMLYTPEPTAHTSVPPLSVTEDTPVTPDDTHEALVQFALSKLWLRGREKQQSDDTMVLYNAVVANIRRTHILVTQADTFNFKPLSPVY